MGVEEALFWTVVVERESVALVGALSVVDVEVEGVTRVEESLETMVIVCGG